MAPTPGGVDGVIVVVAGTGADAADVVAGRCTFPFVDTVVDKKLGSNEKHRVVVFAPLDRRYSKRLHR